MFYNGFVSRFAAWRVFTAFGSWVMSSEDSRKSQRITNGWWLLQNWLSRQGQRLSVGLTLISKGSAEVRPRTTMDFRKTTKFESFNFNMLTLESKMNENVTKNSPRNVIYNMNPMYQNPNASFVGNVIGGKYSSINNSKEHNNNNSSNNSNSKEDITNATNAVDKRFKTLPAAEMLPRNEVLGGYIFVCNNDTMQEDLKRQLFGLPPRYIDSVRAITPGLPLFLYNYTTHQLHGIFEVCSNFWGTNIDPTAWEDKKCKGESRFPAQVRIRVRKICKPLEEDAFRPVLHHYDGPKFRLELSVPETLDLLDLCEQTGA
ncbi:UNVERIFIED_CONTAM: B2 protein [Sesamum calycinum]|uniref:B2 protein n=1 Tax=Sesamum calycinum TaxID=2727403 RepID=A0AAW2SU57_9LAMI